MIDVLHNCWQHAISQPANLQRLVRCSVHGWRCRESSLYRLVTSVCLYVDVVTTAAEPVTSLDPAGCDGHMFLVTRAGG